MFHLKGSYVGYVFFSCSAQTLELPPLRNSCDSLSLRFLQIAEVPFPCPFKLNVFVPIDLLFPPFWDLEISFQNISNWMNLCFIFYDVLYAVVKSILKINVT